MTRVFEWCKISRQGREDIASDPQSRLSQALEIRGEFKVFQSKAKDHELEELKLHISLETNRLILQGDL